MVQMERYIKEAEEGEGEHFWKEVGVVEEEHFAKVVGVVEVEQIVRNVEVVVAEGEVVLKSQVKEEVVVEAEEEENRQHT